VEWKTGAVRYEGEIWKATSEEDTLFASGENATIYGIKKLSLKIKKA